MTRTAPQTSADNTQISDATLRGFLGYQMKRTFNVMQVDLARTLKPFGLRMLTYTALVLIVDNPGMRQSQLADAMDIERPNLVVLIDQLEGRGLINRDRVPTDRRAYALQATLAGRRIYEKAVAAVTAHENKLLQGIDTASLQSMITTMKRIENLKG